MSSIIQSRRDTAANWSSVNPILAQGEKGYETDSIGTSEALYKIGDGVSTWSALSYQSSGGGAVDSVNGQIGTVVLGTGDITETTDKNYVTDADLTTLIDVPNKVDKSDLPTKTTVGAIKADYDATTNTLQISIDGTDIL
jgi:hypothetical protein